MAAPNFADKTIWTGDNLDILRGLNSECVDLIYLDPPFNSNRDYEAPVGSKAAGAAFKDTWTLSDLDVAWMGLIADEHPPIAYLLDTAGKVHGKGMQSYLTMMAVRLLEMRRILKPTGSIYLHCDPYASHYLKMLMDVIFGRRNFRNELVWCYEGRELRKTRYNSKHDVLLFYSKAAAMPFYWETIAEPLKEASVKAMSRFTDAEGRPYVLRYKEGGGFAPLRLEGSQHVYRQYVPDKVPPRDWVHIDVARKSERTGYPTQKPLALLDRIIRASSNEGDMVLDPFAGCATACVAADTLGRRWAGIDISPKAVELVNMRLQQSMGSLFHNRYVTDRTDLPLRTDIDAPVNYRKNAHVLFGQQEGQCAGCQMDFPFKIFEVDHVVPRARGGTDHLANLQLLCPHCNRIKGDRPQEYLMAELRKQGATP